MSEEAVTTAPAPSVAGLMAPAESPPETPPATETPPPAEPAKGKGKESKETPKEPEKPSPKARDWAEVTKLERKAREAMDRAKAREAEAEKRIKEIESGATKRSAEDEEVVAAFKSRDSAKLIKLLGVEGFQRLSVDFLKSRAAASKTGAKPVEVDVDAIVEKKLAEREAEREKKAAEEREAKQKAEAAAADERFSSLTKQGVELVLAGGDRYAQIRAELTGSEASERVFNATLRSINDAIMSPEGWTVGGKTLKGQGGLDVALDMLEDYLVERAEKLLSDKVRARLTKPAEKPAEDGGTRKSETDGPSTLTQRLATETPPTRASKAIPENESPLARKQREERELEAKTIAETEAIIAATLAQKKAS
jgi:hypothetical protein